MLRGDALGILAARALGADAVAAPINVSTALERCGWFARTRRTRIGSPYVVEAASALAAEGARLAVGFEANGGFLLAGAPSATAAGSSRFRPATRCCRCSRSWPRRRRGRQSLADLSAALPPRATASGRMEQVAEARSRALLARLEASAARTATPSRAMSPGTRSSRSTRTDGLRMTLASGEILHLRASGNAPELRCYAEAADEARARSLAATMLAHVATLARGRIVTAPGVGVAVCTYRRPEGARAAARGAARPARRAPTR